MRYRQIARVSFANVALEFRYNLFSNLFESYGAPKNPTDTEHLEQCASECKQPFNPSLLASKEPDVGRIDLYDFVELVVINQDCYFNERRERETNRDLPRVTVNDIEEDRKSFGVIVKEGNI